MSNIEPFDPLDPDHRLQRNRERTAFFRQTDIFPIVVLAMVVFVPLALWQKPLAIPFLGWMALMPHIVSGVDRTIAGMRGTKVALEGSLFRSAMLCIALYFAITLTLSVRAALIAAGILAAVYGYGVISGLLWREDDQK